MEIERKFLLKDIPSEISLPKKYKSITQLYLLASANGEVRLRRVHDRETNTISYVQTVKSSGDLVRSEVESEVPEQLFNLVVQNKLYFGTILQKLQYKILIPLSPESNITKTLELDVYRNKFIDEDYLILAEIEFDSIEEANSFIPPSWLQTEVTSNAEFKNKSLALTTKIL